METIDYKVNDDGVAILTIDLKDRSMNVLTPEFVRDLHECVEKVAGRHLLTLDVHAIRPPESEVVEGTKLGKVTGIADRLVLDGL